MPLFNADIESPPPPAVARMRDTIRNADALLVVTPEYNYSMSGVLKNAIDWASRPPDQPFAGKPIALQSASGGPLGGSRMQYHLRQSMVFLDGLVFTRPEIFVGMAPQKFDEKTLELKDQPTIDIIKQQLAGFEKFIRRVGGKN